MMWAHLSPVMGKVLQVWQRTLWRTFWLTDRRYRVGNHSNRGGSLCSHDNMCCSLVIGVNTCKHTVSLSPWRPPMSCSWDVLFSHPFKTRPHRLLHTTEHSIFLHRRRNLNAHTHFREREGTEGHAGKCHVFTWLRSCSKDLSPDLLTDPDLILSSATPTRAAVSQCVLFWRKHTRAAVSQCFILKETLSLITINRETDRQIDRSSPLYFSSRLSADRTIRAVWREPAETRPAWVLKHQQINKVYTSICIKSIYINSIRISTFIYCI